MLDERLFEYYGIHLHGLVVSNAEEPDIAGDDDDEPELILIEVVQPVNTAYTR